VVTFLVSPSISILSTDPDYSRVVVFSNGASYNQFLNNQIIGVSTTGTTSSNAVIYSTIFIENNNIIQNNLIQNGSYGIWFFGGDIDNLESGNIVSGNQFIDQYRRGIYLRYQDAPIIEKNTVVTSSDYNDFRAIWCRICDNNIIIQQNKISAPATSGGIGIYIDESWSTFFNEGLIANNFVHINTNGNDSYGIFNNNSNYQNYYYNSVNITGTNTGSGTINIDTASLSLILKNNILTNNAEGFVFYSENSSGTITSDYNDLYTNGSYLAYWNLSNIADLTEWQSSPGYDANSVSIIPNFYSDSDLHLDSVYNLLKIATPITEVPEDIDSETRNASTPYLGADEYFTPVFDVGISDISPSASCKLSDSETIIVTIKNYGTGRIEAEDTIIVVMEFENNPFDTDTLILSVDLNPGTTMDYSFADPVDMSSTRDYSFFSYTILPVYLENNNENDTLSTTVTVYGNPTVDLGVDQSLCEGNEVILTADPGYTYLWTGGATNQSLSVDTSGAYSVNITDANGCQDADTVTVTFFSLPAAPVIDDTTICYGDTIPELSATGTDIKWYKDPTLDTLLYSGSLYTPDDTLSGIYSYYLTQTEAINSCESLAEEVIFTIDEAVNSPVISDELICFDETIPVMSATGVNVQWYSDSAQTTLIFTGNSYTPGETDAGIYYYFVTQSVNSCESPHSKTSFTINPVPIITGEESTDETECNSTDGTITITASGEAPLEYSIDDGVSFVQNDGSFTGLDAGTYKLVVKNVYSCTATGSTLLISSTVCPEFCLETQSRISSI